MSIAGVYCCYKHMMRRKSMEIFIFIMAIFAFIGLVDYTFNLGLGLAKEFEKGLNTMGGLALSVVGFYAIGVSFVQNNAEQIAALTKNIPFDPSLIIGSLLAPDMGAMGIATNIAATPQLAVFSGALVAGGLGATIGYQLPVFLAAVQKDEIPDLMQGFICGIIPLPVGLFIGGMMLGVPLNALIVNMIPVTILCVVLILAVAFAPNATTKVLTFFGNFIRVISYIFFAVTVFGVFMPQYSPVNLDLVPEILYMIFRMVIVACGGLVLSKIILTKFPQQIAKVGKKMHINNHSVVGVILSFVQSLAMLPVFSQMDSRGKVVNAAFSVCGAYVIGGQLAFVASICTPYQTAAYMTNKLVSGFLGIAIALFVCRKKDRQV